MHTVKFSALPRIFRHPKKLRNFSRILAIKQNDLPRSGSLVRCSFLSTRTLCASCSNARTCWTIAGHSVDCSPPSPACSLLIALRVSLLSLTNHSEKIYFFRTEKWHNSSSLKRENASSAGTSGFSKRTLQVPKLNTLTIKLDKLFHFSASTDRTSENLPKLRSN